MIRNMKDADLKKALADKLGALLTIPEDITFTTPADLIVMEDGMEITAKISASVAHPDFESFAIQVTFRI